MAPRPLSENHKTTCAQNQGPSTEIWERENLRQTCTYIWDIHTEIWELENLRQTCTYFWDTRTPLHGTLLLVFCWGLGKPRFHWSFHPRPRPPTTHTSMTLWDVLEPFFWNLFACWKHPYFGLPFSFFGNILIFFLETSVFVGTHPYLLKHPYLWRASLFLMRVPILSGVHPNACARIQQKSKPCQAKPKPSQATPGQEPSQIMLKSC